MKKDLTIEDLALSLEEAGELIIPQNVEATWKKRLPVPFSLSLNKVWNRYVIGENYDGSIEYIGDPIVVRTKANSDGQIIRPIIITTESHRYDYENILPACVYPKIPEAIAKKHGVTYMSTHEGEHRFETSVSQCGFYNELVSSMTRIKEARKEMNSRTGKYIQRKTEEFMELTGDTKTSRADHADYSSECVS